LISGNLAACAFVERSHLLRKVERDDLEEVFAAARLRCFEPGATIIREGEPGDELFLVQDGEVKVVTNSLAGAVELARLSRGAFFGEVALLTGRPRTATVTAVSDVTVIAISNDAMEGILRRYPKVRKLLQAVVEARVKSTIEKTQGVAE